MIRPFLLSLCISTCALAALPAGEAALQQAIENRLEALFQEKDVLASLELFARLVKASPDSRELARNVAAAFDVYRSPGLAPSGDVLYTAYHEPVFDGRLKEEGAYRHPVYRDPATAGVPTSKY